MHGLASLVALTFIQLLQNAVAAPADDLSMRTLAIQCTPAETLPPVEDCLRILNALQDAIARIPFHTTTWGRSVTPSPEGDFSSIKLPHGFQMVYTDPDPNDPIPPCKCEVHLDNADGKHDETDTFDMMVMVFAGSQVLNECTQKRGLAGLAFPTPQRNVFVSTLYTPGNGAPSRVVGATNITASSDRTITYIDQNGRIVTPDSIVEIGNERHPDPEIQNRPLVEIF